MQIEKINIDDLTPYEGNAKLHPQEQIEQIITSIERYGNNDPIAVWGKDNIIVEGHGRYLALQEMGVDEVEIIRLDHMTDEERREYTLVHNKLTMNTDFDFDILMDELDSLDADMTDFGFDIDVDEIDPVEITEDKPPENVETRCKLGDLWQMGGAQTYLW